MRYFFLMVILFGFFIRDLKSHESPVMVESSARFIETQFNYPSLTSDRTDPPGWNLYNGFPSDVSSDNRFLNRNTNSLLTVGAKYTKQFDHLRLNLDLDLVKRNEASRDLLYAGKNNYISYEWGDFYLGVGKRQFLFRKSPFVGYSDGGEGVFLEKQIHRKWFFQIFVWDFYKGYRLLEKEYLSPELLSGKETEIQKGQRRRHSFGFTYEDAIKLSFGVSYLEFGTFGRQTRELNQNTNRYGADGDSALLGNAGAKYEIHDYYICLELLWTKGVDRTPNKTTTTPGSLIIEGEAVSLGIGYADSFLSYGLSLFLSDREERNSENQIIKLGYMNTGTHLGSTYFLSQYLQLFPSAHFSGNGLERNQTILSGHPQSSYGELFVSIHLFDVLMKLTAAVLIPYQAIGQSDGKISVKKEDYEKFYFGEVSYDLSYKNERNQIGITVSYITSTSALPIHGTLMQAYGSIYF